MSILTFDDGILRISDPCGAIMVAEYGMRQSVDAGLRRHYLSVATLCAQAVYSPKTPAWGGPDVPTPEIERMAILTAALGIRHGDENYLATFGAYAGLVDLRERDTLAEILYGPKRDFLGKVLKSPEPTRYLAGAIRRKISVSNRSTAQAGMSELDADLDGAEIGMDVTPGIDCGDYLGALRASGKPADLELARDVEEWLAGVPKQIMGDARYQRVLYHLRQPRARAIGNRARAAFLRGPGCGVMAPPPWFYSSGRKDSVWHRQNAHLIQ